MKPIAYINVQKRRLEFAEPIKWHTPTVANLDRIPLFTKEVLAQPEQEPVAHWSDCAVHSEPAYPKGECDCGGFAAPPQRTEQEPVAWMHVQGNYKEPSFRGLADDEVERGWEQYPLYNTPPQRTWVGLTDEEIQECYSEAYKIVQGRQLEIAFYKTIEAKLKQKNGFAEENT